MITKDLVTLTLIIGFIISVIIILLYNHLFKRNSNYPLKATEDTFESNFSTSKIDDSDIKIICK